MIGAYGYLPNDRRHSLKLFGNYDITDEWSIGTNLLVQSGRPINCIGVLQGSGRQPLRQHPLLLRPGCTGCQRQQRRHHRVPRYRRSHAVDHLA